MVPSLKLTASSPLKMDGWNAILSYWVSAYFQGLFPVSFREGTLSDAKVAAGSCWTGVENCREHGLLGVGGKNV